MNIQEEPVLAGATAAASSCEDALRSSPPIKKKIQTSFDDDKNTFLHFAAARGLLEEVVRLVQDEDHKIDAENYLGWTPLMMATRNGHATVVKYLLDKRADVTRKNKFGGSIFLMAVATGNLDILHVVLEHLLCGGVSRQSLENTFSPISVAILFNQEEVFNYLLRKRFSENAITPITGLTPLMFAAVSDNQSFISTLISKMANQSVKNINGETAQDILQKKRGGVVYHEEVPKQPCLQHPQIPKVVVYSPQPTYYVPSPSAAHIVHRKSSNCVTPNYCYVPNISPITPMGYYRQMFFPPNFSPSQFMCTTHNLNGSYYSDDYSQMNSIFSPVPTINYPSPCGTVQFQTDKYSPYFGYSGNHTPVPP